MKERAALISSFSPSSITSSTADSRLSTCSFDIPVDLFETLIKRRYAEMR
ncbi:hypothetical protein HMPREF1550_01896 [Actinomyces sp. oral taxon 877 str. F0543]|nr:hypothetical protein HMPREF1550_01896 [Actinomyces sp. oral taxon 877 str. F0543]